MSYFQRLYFEDCLRTALWAGGVAVALQLLGAISGWSTSDATRAVSVALVVGLFAGLVSMKDMPPLPVAERWQWVPWLTAATLLLLCVEEGKAAPVARVPLLILLAGSLEWTILRPSIVLEQSTPSLHTIVMIAVGIAIFLILWGGEARAALQPAWRLFLCYAFTAAGAGFCYAASTSTRFGQMNAGLAAALGSAAVVGLGKNDAKAGRTPVSVATMAYGGMLLVNALSSDFPKVPAVLLLIAWLVPLVPHPGTKKTNAIQFIAVVVTVGLAVLIAKG